MRAVSYTHLDVYKRQISFTSDWLFPTSESRAIVHALNAAGARVSFAEITTDKGHDAFLLDEPELFLSLIHI